MRVNLKCFADLANQYECSYDQSVELDTSEGTTIRGVLKNSGIPEEKVKISFVNGIITDINQELNHGDNLTLVPPSGGM